MRHLLINTVLMNPNQTNFCSIHYNGVRDLTHQSWQGNLSEADLEKGYGSALDVLEKTACPSVIHDCRKVAHMDADVDSLHTITRQWLHQAKARGVRYVAHITSSAFPVDPFEGLRSLGPEQDQYECEVFDNVDEALSWIAYKNEFGF